MNIFVSLGFYLWGMALATLEFAVALGGAVYKTANSAVKQAGASKRTIALCAAVIIGGTTLIYFQPEAMTGADIVWECWFYPAYDATSRYLLAYVAYIYQFAVSRWNDVVLYLRQCLSDFVAEILEIPEYASAVGVFTVIDDVWEFLKSVISTPFRVASVEVPYVTPYLETVVNATMCPVDMVFSLVGDIIVGNYDGIAERFVAHFYSCAYQFADAATFGALTGGQLRPYLAKFIGDAQCLTTAASVGVDAIVDGNYFGRSKEMISMGITCTQGLLDDLTGNVFTDVVYDIVEAFGRLPYVIDDVLRAVVYGTFLTDDVFFRDYFRDQKHMYCSGFRSDCIRYYAAPTSGGANIYCDPPHYFEEQLLYVVADVADVLTGHFLMVDSPLTHTYRGFFFDLADVAACIVSSWKNFVLFIYVTVASASSDTMCYQSPGAVSPVSHSTLSGYAAEQFGGLFVQFFKCLGELLDVITNGYVTDFFEWLFEQLKDLILKFLDAVVQFVNQIIDSAACFQDPAFQACVSGYPDDSGVVSGGCSEAGCLGYPPADVSEMNPAFSCPANPSCVYVKDSMAGVGCPASLRGCFVGVFQCLSNDSLKFLVPMRDAGVFGAALNFFGVVDSVVCPFVGISRCFDSGHMGRCETDCSRDGGLCPGLGGGNVDLYCIQQAFDCAKSVNTFGFLGTVGSGLFGFIRVVVDAFQDFINDIQGSAECFASASFKNCIDAYPEPSSWSGGSCNLQYCFETVAFGCLKHPPGGGTFEFLEPLRSSGVYEAAAGFFGVVDDVVCPFVNMQACFGGLSSCKSSGTAVVCSNPSIVEDMCCDGDASSNFSKFQGMLDLCCVQRAFSCVESTAGAFGFLGTVVKNVVGFMVKAVFKPVTAILNFVDKITRAFNKLAGCFNLDCDGISCIKDFFDCLGDVFDRRRRSAEAWGFAPGGGPGLEDADVPLSSWAEAVQELGYAPNSTCWKVLTERTPKESREGGPLGHAAYKGCLAAIAFSGLVSGDESVPGGRFRGRRAGDPGFPGIFEAAMEHAADVMGSVRASMEEWRPPARARAEDDPSLFPPYRREPPQWVAEYRAGEERAAVRSQKYSAGVKRAIASLKDAFSVPEGRGSLGKRLVDAVRSGAGATRNALRAVSTVADIVPSTTAYSVVSGFVSKVASIAEEEAREPHVSDGGGGVPANGSRLRERVSAAYDDAARELLTIWKSASSAHVGVKSTLQYSYYAQHAMLRPGEGEGTARQGLSRRGNAGKRAPPQEGRGDWEAFKSTLLRVANRTAGAVAEEYERRDMATKAKALASLYRVVHRNLGLDEWGPYRWASAADHAARAGDFRGLVAYARGQHDYFPGHGFVSHEERRSLADARDRRAREARERSFARFVSGVYSPRDERESYGPFLLRPVTMERARTFLASREAMEYVKAKAEARAEAANATAGAARVRAQAAREVPPSVTLMLRAFDLAGSLLLRVEGGATALWDAAVRLFEGADWVSFLHRTTDFVQKLVTCNVPEDFDGTLPYNPFCAPLLPEAALSWFYTPPPTWSVPTQIPWPEGLVVSGCSNAGWGPGASGPVDCDNPFDPSCGFDSQYDNCGRDDGGTRPFCPTCQFCEREYAYCDAVGVEDPFDVLLVALDALPWLYNQTMVEGLPYGSAGVARLLIVSALLSTLTGFGLGPVFTALLFVYGHYARGLVLAAAALYDGGLFAVLFGAGVFTLFWPVLPAVPQGASVTGALYDAAAYAYGLPLVSTAAGALLPLDVLQEKLAGHMHGSSLPPASQLFCSLWTLPHFALLVLFWYLAKLAIKLGMAVAAAGLAYSYESYVVSANLVRDIISRGATQAAEEAAVARGAPAAARPATGGPWQGGALAPPEGRVFADLEDLGKHVDGAVRRKKR